MTAGYCFCKIKYLNILWTCNFKRNHLDFGVICFKISTSCFNINDCVI